MKRFIHSVFLAALLLLSAGQAHAQDTLRIGDTTDFCRSLHDVIESSKLSFSDIRGDVSQESNDYFGRKVRYNVITGFPEAICSYIEFDMSHRYQTVLDSQLVCTDSLKGRFQHITKQIKICLGTRYSYNELDVKEHNELLFQAQADDLYEPNVQVRLAEENKKYVLSLEVIEPFFKRKE